MKKIRFSMIYFLVIISAAIFMVYKSLQFKGSIAGAPGPGLYPRIILFLIIISGVIIVVQNLKKFDYKFISPYSKADTRARFIELVYTIFSNELEGSMSLEVSAGEGFFSVFKKIKGINKTNVLTVIPGDKRTTPNFLGAHKALDNYDPIARLTFNPDVLIVRDDKSLDSLNIKELLNKKVGFYFPEESPYYLKEALNIRGNLDIDGVHFNDTYILIKSLNDKEIDIAVCPLNKILDEEYKDKYELVAVTAMERVDEFPDVPTLEEKGIDIVSGKWIGIGCPKGASLDYKNKIHSTLINSEKYEEAKKEIKSKDFRLSLLSPEKFEKFLKKQKEIMDEISEDVEVQGQPNNLLLIVESIILFIIFVFLFPHINFLLNSFIFITVSSILIWPVKKFKDIPFWKIILISGLVTFSVYTIFTTVFDVVFP